MIKRERTIRTTGPEEPKAGKAGGRDGEALELRQQVAREAGWQGGLGH